MPIFLKNQTSFYSVYVSKPVWLFLIELDIFLRPIMG